MKKISVWLHSRLGMGVLFAVGLLGLLWMSNTLVSASFLKAVTQAEPPPAVISYQGRIQLDGQAYDGSGYFKFAIVDSDGGDGSSNYWANDGTTSGEPNAAVTLAVSQGLFNVLLGDTSLAGMSQALDATAFNASATYLRVWFSENGVDFQALEPNQRFASVAYALRSETAQSVQQLTQEFVVASGQSVTAGDVVSFLDGAVRVGFASGDRLSFGAETAFSPPAPYQISAAALSDTKLVVVYGDNRNGGYGTAVIGDVSGDTITFGPAYVFNPAFTLTPSVTALSSSKFVVAFVDGGNAEHGTAMVGDVSGTLIGFGAEYEFNPASTAYTAMAALSSTKFVVVYRDSGNGNFGTAVIGDVSGNTISNGAEFVFNAAATSSPSPAVLSSSKFVVAFLDNGNSNYGISMVGDVSGSSIAFGAEAIFNLGSTYQVSAAALTNAKYVAAYRDSNQYGSVIVGDVSGSNISHGSETIFNPAPSNDVSVAGLSSSQFVVAYRDESNTYAGTSLVGEVSGTALSFGQESVFNPDQSNYNAITPLSSARFVVAYEDAGINETYGMAVVGHAVAGNLVGMARQAGTEGQTVAVVTGGVSDLHSGLTPGRVYYLDLDGSLTTAHTPWPVGLAISSSQILLDIDVVGK